jgi:RF-1 domain
MKNKEFLISRICFAHFFLLVTMVLQICRLGTLVHAWCPQNLPRASRIGASRTSRLDVLGFMYTRRSNAWVQGRKECFSTLGYPSLSSLRFFSNDDCIRNTAYHQHQWRYPLFLLANSRFCFRFFSKNEIEADALDDEYDSELDEAKSSHHRQWIVPTRISIPEDQLTIKFVRSSGAGGQNVNKVSSCVQVRFHVQSAEWMGPYEVRERFMEAYKNQISKDGMFQMESQVHRTQPQNRKDVMEKIEHAVLAVWPRPKLRRVRFGLSEKGERKRKEEKTKQSSKKESRRSVRYDF